MKQKFVGSEEKIIYYYSETNTVQTTFKNGLNVFKFSNGQIEKHYPDGSKKILFSEVDEFSTLVLETTDLFIKPSHRVLFIFKGSPPIIVFIL